MNKIDQENEKKGGNTCHHSKILGINKHSSLITLNMSQFPDKKIQSNRMDSKQGSALWKHQRNTS